MPHHDPTTRREPAPADRDALELMKETLHDLTPAEARSDDARGGIQPTILTKIPTTSALC